MRTLFLLLPCIAIGLVQAQGQDTYYVAPHYYNGTFIPGQYITIHPTAPPGTVGKYGSPSYLQSPNNSAGVGPYGGSPLYGATMNYPQVPIKQYQRTPQEQARIDQRRAAAKANRAANAKQRRARRGPSKQLRDAHANYEKANADYERALRALEEEKIRLWNIK